jgi:hypothetical protein
VDLALGAKHWALDEMDVILARCARSDDLYVVALLAALARMFGGVFPYKTPSESLAPSV